MSGLREERTRLLTVATLEAALPGKLVRHASQSQILAQCRVQPAPLRRTETTHLASSALSSTVPADPIPSLLLRKDQDACSEQSGGDQRLAESPSSITSATALPARACPELPASPRGRSARALSLARESPSSIISGLLLVLATRSRRRKVGTAGGVQ